MEKPPNDDDGGKEYGVDEIAELEDTAAAACRGIVGFSLLDAGFAGLYTDNRCSGAELRGSRAMMDDAARWRLSLIRLLDTTCC